MYWVIIILIIVLTLFLVWASADVGSNIYLKAACKGRCNDSVVALTFDDGPDEIMTPKVLDVLKQYDIKATFFLVGSKVDKHPDIVRRIVKEGHTVANHTYSHAGLFPLCNASEVAQELTKCRNSILTATGLLPKLFRPPFGVTNPIIGKVVKKFGLTTIGWSVRSLDTVNRKSREEICNRVVTKLHPGAIILLHERCHDAERVLEMVITAALDKNYSFTTVDRMLNIDAYEN